MTIRRVTRDRRLSAEEAAKYRAARDKVKEELPELLTRHHARAAAEAPFPTGELLNRLRHEREAAGLSLTDMAERTGIDKAALSRLENGHQDNPTVETLSRYAAALGKQLVWSVVDLPEAGKPAK